MKQLEFEWDDAKNRSNRRKHGVSFEEACSAFQDPRARIIPDPDHSDDEDRFVLLGLSEELRLLVVCHCLRGEDFAVRIISARKATRQEAGVYEDLNS